MVQQLRPKDAMKTIPLSKNMVALVDDADYDFLSQWKWSASLESRGTKWYAIRWSRKSEHGEGKRFKIRMHRVLMGLPHKDESVVVDHKDRNGLNNQRSNFELVTQTENMERVPTWKGSRTWKTNKELTPTDNDTISKNAAVEESTTYDGIAVAIDIKQENEHDHREDQRSKGARKENLSAGVGCESEHLPLGAVCTEPSEPEAGKRQLPQAHGREVEERQAPNRQ